MLKIIQPAVMKIAIISKATIAIVNLSIYITPIALKAKATNAIAPIVINTIINQNRKLSLLFLLDVVTICFHLTF